MRVVRVLFLGSVIVLGSARGQVCCSLVGAIEHGGGASSTHWGTHWPSRFDNRNQSKWVVGFNSTHTEDKGLNIRYGTAYSTHIQLSRYLTPNTVGYVQGETSLIRLEESLSFEQESSRVQQWGLRTGVRYLLPGKWGLMFGEYSNPAPPNFSNPDFVFTTGAVSSAMLGWINRFQTPWSVNHPSVLSDYSLSFSYGKNLKKQDDVYLDDAINAHISTSIYTSKFKLSPFATLQSQKLLAPLSPWDENRQTRWLGVINFGFDFTLSHHKLNWVHLRVNFPVYRWTSHSDFPDGTEPVPRISISFSRGGILRKFTQT